MITFLTGAAFFAPAHFHDLSASVVYAAAGLPNVYFWQQSGYFDISSEFKPLLHTWSLGVEGQFYLVWPLVLLLALKLRPRIEQVALIAAAGAVSLLLSVLHESEPEAIFFLPWFRVFEFAIGAALVWLTKSPPARAAAEVAVVLGTVLIASSVVLFSDAMVFPSTSALLPCAGTALLIYGGEKSRLGRYFANPIVAYVGTLSYSLYLVHWPVLVFWHYLEFDDMTAVDTALAIALAFGLSYLLHRYIELPVYKGRWSTILTGKTLGTAAIALLVTIGVVATLPFAAGGWQFRSGAAAVRYPTLAGLGEVEFRRTQYGGAGTTPKFVSGPAPATVLIAGDSHARLYYAGLAEVLPDGTGVQVLDEGSCVFRVRRCGAFDAAIKSFLELSPDGLLFLSQRWDFHKHVALHFGQDAVGKISASELADFYAGRIAATYEIFSLPKDQRLFIAGATPQVVSFGDVATCLLRPIQFGPRADCTRADMRDYRIAYRREFNARLGALIRELNARNGWSIQFGDPFDPLCQHNACLQVLEGQILYNDHDHLSVAGSRLVVGAFGRGLLDLLQRRPFVVHPPNIQ